MGRGSSQKASIARTDKAALKRKLTKLKELYVNDLIDIEDYKKTIKYMFLRLTRYRNQRRKRRQTLQLCAGFLIIALEPFMIL